MKGNCPLRQDPKPCVAWREGWQRATPEQVEDGDSCRGTPWMLVSYSSRRKAPLPPVQGLSWWDQRLYWGRSPSWLSLIHTLEQCEPLKWCLSLPTSFLLLCFCSIALGFPKKKLIRMDVPELQVSVGSTLRCVMCVPTVRNHPVVK